MKISQLSFSIVFCLFLMNMAYTTQAKESFIDAANEKSVVGPPFIFSFPAMTCVEPGEQVCIDVRADGFQDVLGFQYGVQYDPSILQFDFGTTDVFKVFDFGAELPVTGEPIITVAWGSLLGIPLSIGNDAVLYSLCFTAIGNLGDCSPLEFVLQAGGAQGAQIQVETTTGAFFVPDVQFNNGEVCIKQNNNTELVVDVTPINASCNGATQGSIILDISGGTPFYEVFAANCTTGAGVYGPQTTTGTANINNLPAGDYCIEITDSNTPSNTYTNQVTITDGTVPVVLGYDSLSVSCANALDGEIEILIQTGATPIASYDWEEVFSGTTYSGNPITGLGGGTYNVTVTDTDGCSTTSSVTLFMPAAFDFDLVNTQLIQPSCAGYPDGRIIVQLIGGTADYTYTFDGNTTTGPNGQVYDGYVAGTYTISVTDANGCGPITTDFILVDPPEIEITFSDVTDVSCNGQPPFDGKATATAINGPESVYTYRWESNESSLDVSTSTACQLMQGWQTVGVTSGTCFREDSVFIDAPPVLGVDQDLTTINNVTCFGAADGEITVVPTGGVGGYTYTWNTMDNTATVDDLSAGIYNVLIQDANDCIQPLIVEISEPDLLESNIDPISKQEITCAGLENGVLVVAYTGGSGNVSYQWSTGSNDTLATNTGLGPGTYTVTITDQNGCTSTATDSLITPPPITAVIPEPAQPNCYGQQTSISVAAANGGTGMPYTFTVNAGQAVPVGPNQAIPVFAGEYTLSIFDGNGCSIQEEINITEPSEIFVNAGDDLEVNLGQDIQLLVQIQSSLTIDSIIWTPGDTSLLSCNNCQTPTATILNSTTFNVLVVDENGCTNFDEVYVDVDKDRNVFFPNVFTPNGDGINDYFSPFTGVGVSNVNTFHIFDRWGELVYYNEMFLPGGSEFQFGWDGKLRGKRASSGVYYYLAEIVFIDGTVLLYRGDITIMR